MDAEQGYWERLRRYGVSRRRLIAGSAAGSLGLAALAAGCSSSKSTNQPATSGNAPASRGATSTTGSTASPAAKQPKRGGTVNHSNSQESVGDTLDPQTSTPLKGEGLRLTYEGLINYDPVTWEVQPELAQKWEQPDPMAYVFHLQSGVKWQNKAPAGGRSFTADDVVYSLNRARSDDPNFTSRSLLDSVDTIQATDGSTVRLNAKALDAALLNKISADSLLMVAKEVVEKAGKFATPDSVVGTGPFVITQVGDHVGAEWVRNPDYWRAGQPYLDGFQTHYFGSPGNQDSWAAFLGGQLDMAVVPGAESKKYLSQQPSGDTPLWFPDTGPWVMTPNTKVKPFDDPRVTKALRLLCDHQEFKTAWGEGFYGRAADGAFLPVSLASWDFTQQEYTQFLEWKQPKDDAVNQALQLLSAAGFSTSNPLKFQLGGTQDYDILATLLQSQWRKFAKGAIDTNIKIFDVATYQQVRAKRDFAYGAFSNSASFNEVDTNLTQLYHGGSSRNYWGYADPKFDGMVDKQRTIFDVNQRKAAVKDILRYMIDNAPGAVFTERFFLNAAKPQVRNFTPEFWLHGAQYHQVWLDS